MREESGKGKQLHRPWWVRSVIERFSLLMVRKNVSTQR